MAFVKRTDAHLGMFQRFIILSRNELNFKITLSCTCPTLYSGTVCQFQTNNCASNPCLNGGLCQNTVFGFTCICLNSYTGPTCQTMVDVNSLKNLKPKRFFF